MKHQDNLTSLDTGCRTWWDCQDNLTCLDVKTVETIVKAQAGTAELTEASVQRYTEQCSPDPVDEVDDV